MTSSTLPPTPGTVVEIMTATVPVSLPRSEELFKKHLKEVFAPEVIGTAR